MTAAYCYWELKSLLFCRRLLALRWTGLWLRFRYRADTQTYQPYNKDWIKEKIYVLLRRQAQQASKWKGLWPTWRSSYCFNYLYVCSNLLLSIWGGGVVFIDNLYFWWRGEQNLNDLLSIKVSFQQLVWVSSHFYFLSLCYLWMGEDMLCFFLLSLVGGGHFCSEKPSLICYGCTLQTSLSNHWFLLFFNFFGEISSCPEFQIKFFCGNEINNDPLLGCRLEHKTMFSDVDWFFFLLKKKSLCYFLSG